MWQNISNSLSKAFELLFHPTPLLKEIVGTTMLMALQSTLYATLIGTLVGCFIALRDFRGKRAVVTILRTLQGLPPVVVGIFLYLLFSGVGPFGSLRLIYSVELMIIAQVILISPVVAGMTENALSPIFSDLRETTIGLGFSPLKTVFFGLNEGKIQMVSTIMFAFARSTAEVGAVQIVGGNILHKTRVMTTAIMMNYNTGSFELALAFGIILILIALIVNTVATLLSQPRRKNVSS